MGEQEIPMLLVWDVGDTRQLRDSELDALRVSDAYDSYEQSYTIDGALWKVIDDIHHPNGHSDHKLECIAVAS